MSQTNLGDKNSVDSHAKKARALEKQDKEDIRKLLETDFGRRFIWRYLSDAGIYTSSFTGNSWTYFNEGRRDIGLKLLAEVMNANPEAYGLMVKEANTLKGDK